MQLARAQLYELSRGHPISSRPARTHIRLSRVSRSSELNSLTAVDVLLSPGIQCSAGNLQHPTHQPAQVQLPSHKRHQERA